MSREQKGSYGINACHTLHESPDGTALLVKAWLYEGLEFAVLDSVAPGSSMVRLYDSYDAWWWDASWTRDSQAILFSNQFDAPNSPLERVALDTLEAERLVDGEAAGLSVYIADEIPSGIAFVANYGLYDDWGSRLYIGRQTADGFSFAPVGKHALCEGAVHIGDIAWNSTGQTAVVLCGRPQLISLDGAERNLGPALGMIGARAVRRVVWGP
jgi:hypothetical protein